MKYARRQLTRARAVSGAVVISIGVALGVNAAILTVVDAVLVRPLPYPHPKRLVQLDGVFTRLPLQVTETGIELSAPLSVPEMARVRSFAAVGAYFVTTMNVGIERPERLRAAAVTAGFFEALDVKPVRGYFFTDEDAKASNRVVVISGRLWRLRFKSDARIVGASLELNGRPFLIVGVLPEQVDYPERSDLWIPYASDPQAAVQVTVPRFVARLAPSATLPIAKADVLSAIRDGALTRQDARTPALRVRPLREAAVGDIRPVLLLIAAAAFLVLLVASLNSANLLLARIVVREREFAVRRAMGASTRRLLLQVFGETAMLATLAAAVSVPVAFSTLAATNGFVGPLTHSTDMIALDHRTFAIIAVLAFIAVGVCALPPALSAGTRAMTALRAGSFATEGVVWRRFRNTLVIVQIATALAMLIIASAITRTVGDLASTDLGARNESAVLLEVLLPKAAYQSSDRILAFHQRVRRELRSVPEIEEAGATDHVPGITTVITPNVAVTIDGQSVSPETGATALRVSATPGYFSALGIDLRAGRSFNETDVRGAPLVAVVSEGYARTVGMKGADILGHRVKAGLSEDRWVEVVGVVQDVRMRGPESDWQPAMYLPFAQIWVNPTTFLVAKVRFGHRPPIAAIRSAIARVDPTIPLYNIRTLADLREEYVSSRRFAMVSVVSFGTVTFALALLGLFAVVHHMVRLRTHEIGIRMAIGASAARVRRQVLTTGASYALAGIVVGAILAFAMFRLAAASIPNLRELDIRVVASLCIVVFVVSIGAAWFPARRASRIDPLLALRAE